MKHDLKTFVSGKSWASWSCRTQQLVKNCQIVSLFSTKCQTLLFCFSKGQHGLKWKTPITWTADLLLNFLNVFSTRKQTYEGFLQLWSQKDEIAMNLMTFCSLPFLSETPPLTFHSFPCLSEASLSDRRCRFMAACFWLLCVVFGRGVTISL